MLWRVPIVLLVIIGAMSMSRMQADALSDGNAPTVRGVASQWENDNNLIDELFQNFNGNESSDGGRKKKETLGPLPAPVSAPVAPPSDTFAQRRARASRETVVFLASDRVVLRIPASLADDLDVSIRIVPAPAGTTPPGPVIGTLVFRVEADAFTDPPPEKLPVEANLSARYTDAELGSRDESKLTLSWLDPSSNTWKTAPKIAADPRTNFISATIQNLGVYAVHQAP